MSVGTQALATAVKGVEEQPSAFVPSRYKHGNKHNVFTDQYQIEY